MIPALQFDSALIQKYDVPGPRYTSYPTAPAFRTSFGEKEYRQAAALSNAAEPPRPISLYVHIPFCRTVCLYCACNRIVTSNHHRAAEYLDYLRTEIRLKGELFDPRRTVSQLHWGGGTPTYLSLEEMAELMGALGESFNLSQDPDRDFGIEVDPRTVDATIINALRELGFNRISLGIQDLDPAVQKAVNRIQPLDETRAVIRSARDASFDSLSVDLMYGLPHQSVRTFRNTVQEVLHLNPDRISLFNYAHLPERFKMQRKIRADTLPAPEEKLRILKMAIGLLTEAGYLYIGMDHFARPGDSMVRAMQSGELQRNFQGYSTHAACDLVGLGMSAISQVGETYAQNEAELDRYYGLLDGGWLPVARGLKLTLDDRIRRKVIHTLMCKFSLDFRAIGQEFDIDFEDYFRWELREIKALETDGLLVVDAEGITISSRGRMLVRQICMLFDRYLPYQTAQAFSRTI
ncbi:MAG: oxygen-independent coproporphyrinogen III oxidase [Gammaproteobacteria bacterium]|nr:oxygen-independent coproporphyrinogen III oxidase [Gammaproteobacteria bacterium]